MILPMVEGAQKTLVVISMAAMSGAGRGEGLWGGDNTL